MVTCVTAQCSAWMSALKKTSTRPPASGPYSVAATRDTSRLGGHSPTTTTTTITHVQSPILGKLFTPAWNRRRLKNANGKFFKRREKSNMAKRYRLRSNVGDRQEVAVREDVCCGFCVEKCSQCVRCVDSGTTSCVLEQKQFICGQWRWPELTAVTPPFCGDVSHSCGFRSNCAETLVFYTNAFS